jgi:tetratricopeptide (TPR) repeat protein
MIVGADRAEMVGARELLQPGELASQSKLTLVLRNQEESLEDPSLALVQAWLLPRLARSPACRRQSETSCQTLQATLAHLRQQSLTAAGMEQILAARQQSGGAELRALEVFILLRLGSWEEAGRVLASHSSPADPSEEELLLAGVRWNFLRRPVEARRALERAHRMDARSALIELELGRAAVQAQDWAAAAQHLDRPLLDRLLAPPAHYLRGRAMIALGDFEGATLEADLLDKAARRKRLPPDSQVFLADLRKRLRAPDARLPLLENVILQPVDELKQAAAELRDLDSSSPPPPGGLDEFLKRVGATVQETIRGLSNTVASEVIRQTQLDRAGRPRTARSVECNYVFVNRRQDGQLELDELRADKRGQAMSPGKLDGGFMMTSGFVSSLMILHPEMQAKTHYRFLGSQPLAHQPTYVVAFAQAPENSDPMGRFNLTSGRATSLYLQGIAWIATDHRVLRLRTDLLHPVPEIGLSRETSEIDYRPYRFASSPVSFLLPSRVTVSVEWGRKRLRNEHILSKFRLFSVEAHDESASAAPSPNAPRQTFRLNPTTENVHVNLGLALDKKGDLGAAIAEYRQALQLNPDSTIAHYNLGLALNDKGDLEAAIHEYREALRLNPGMVNAHEFLGCALLRLGSLDGAIAEYRKSLQVNPDSGSAHYNLGIALGAKGALKEAIAETRTAVRLQPDNPSLHYSLAYWLEKQGDRGAALGEYRNAHVLDPENSEFRGAYERLAHQVKPPREVS